AAKKPEPKLAAKPTVVGKAAAAAAAKPATGKAAPGKPNFVAQLKALNKGAKPAKEGGGEEGAAPTPGDSPLLDSTNASVKKLIAKAKERGYITYDELNAALPSEEMTSEQIEDTMSMLSEMGINVVEGEEQETEEAAEGGEAEVKEAATGGNIDEDDVGRT